MLRKPEQFPAAGDPTIAVRNRAGPWVMHPNTDDLLFALDGSVTIELFDDGGHQRVPLTAGSLVVVPEAAGTATSMRTTWSSCTTPRGRASGCDDPAAASENDN